MQVQKPPVHKGVHNVYTALAGQPITFRHLQIPASYLKK